MKKIRIIGLFLVLFTGMVLFAPINAQAEDKVKVTLDGIIYTLPDLDSPYYGEAELDPNSTRTEIYVHNEIEYQGKYYPIGTFSWDEDSLNDTEDGYADGWVYIDMDKKIPVHETLQKLILAPDITVEGSAVNYKELEEVIFEGKISYRYGFHYFNCPKLKTITIPADYRMRERQSNGFDIKRCPSVRIKVDAANPYFTVIDNEIYSKDGKILYNATNNMTEYRVRKGVKEIAPYALNGNDQITSIYLPNSVEKIGLYAFGCMDNLRSIRMSKSVKVFHQSVILHSKKLKKLELPKKMQKFKCEYSSYYKCKLKKLILKAKKLKKSYFSELPSKCKIIVRNNTVKQQVRKYGYKGKVIVRKNLSK